MGGSGRANTLVVREFGNLQKQNAKIVQLDMAVAMVLHDKASDTYLILEVPLAMPLETVSPCNAQTMHECLRRAGDVPLLQTLQARFEFVSVASVNDSSSVNILAERTIQFMTQPHVPRLRIPCQIHKLHTTTGALFLLFDNMISGIVALGLSMKPGGIVVSPARGN